MQTPVELVIGSTVTADTTGGQTYFHLLLTENVTTFSFNPATPDAQVVWVVFEQDGTGSRTVGFATNIVGSPTIDSTASKTALIGFFFDTSIQSWIAFTATTAHN